MNNNIKLQELEEKATELARHNIWGQEAYEINMAILEIDHNNCAACTRLAKYYRINDNTTKAKGMYLKALDIDPQNRVAINNLYDIEKDIEETAAVGKINSAKELLKEAKKAIRKRKYSLAAKLYSKAFSIEPSLKRATELADVYQKLDMYDKIEELYTHLINDNPIQEETKVIEKEFKLLRR